MKRMHKKMRGIIAVISIIILLACHVIIAFYYSFNNNVNSPIFSENMVIEREDIASSCLTQYSFINNNGCLLSKAYTINLTNQKQIRFRFTHKRFSMHDNIFKDTSFNVKNGEGVDFTDCVSVWSETIMGIDVLNFVIVLNNSEISQSDLIVQISCSEKDQTYKQNPYANCKIKIPIND